MVTRIKVIIELQWLKTFGTSPMGGKEALGNTERPAYYCLSILDWSADAVFYKRDKRLKRFHTMISFLSFEILPTPLMLLLSPYG